MGRLSKKTELEREHLAAKIAATEARAEKTRLETRQRAGELVERKEVEFDAAETATAVVRALEQIPARCACLCVGETAEAIARIIRTEIANAIEAIQQSHFVKTTETHETEAMDKPKRRRGRPAAH